MASGNRTPPWKKPNPARGAAKTTLTPAQKEQARKRAEAAGRRYPNLIDNMAVARQAKKDRRSP